MIERHPDSLDNTLLDTASAPLKHRMLMAQLGINNLVRELVDTGVTATYKPNSAEEPRRAISEVMTELEQAKYEMQVTYNLSDRQMSRVVQERSNAAMDDALNSLRKDI